MKIVQEFERVLTLQLLVELEIQFLLQQGLWKER